MQARLNKEDEVFLKEYNPKLYDNPAISVDTLVFAIKEQKQNNYRKLAEKKLQILLVKRQESPYKGCWSIPGTFVRQEESLDETARRCLEEKVNIKDLYMEQLYTWGEIDRDPRTRIISCSYLVLADNRELNIKAGKNVEATSFFEVDFKIIKESTKKVGKKIVIEKLLEMNLTNGEENLIGKIKILKETGERETIVTREIVQSDGIAFDHLKMIEYAIKRLKNKIEYTDIVFHLMPKYFTLTQLQKVYEIILDKELLKANFRRKIQNMVIETDQIETMAGHRPSHLFQFNPNWEKSDFE